MPKRDSQRGKVYAAERVLWKPPFEQRFNDLDELTAFANKVINSSWTQKHFSNARRGIKVGDGRRRLRACGSWSTNTIKMPVWSRTVPIALHELAHVFTPEMPAHGPYFAKNYLMLVKHFMGKEAHAALKASFKHYRVKTHVRKKTRRLTPEQLIVLRERMKVARQVRMQKLVQRDQLVLDAASQPMEMQNV